jgi:hypothetical protein
MLLNESYITQLEQNTEEVLKCANSISITNLQNRLPDGWSILEILEHICKTDLVLIKIISKPAVTISEMDELIGDEKMHKILVKQGKCSSIFDSYGRH